MAKFKCSVQTATPVRLIVLEPDAEGDTQFKIGDEMVWLSPKETKRLREFLKKHSQSSTEYESAS